MLVEKKFINSVLTMLNLGCQWDVKGERSSRHCLYGSGANENGQEKESELLLYGSNGSSENGYYH